MRSGPLARISDSAVAAAIAAEVIDAVIASVAIAAAVITTTIAAIAIDEKTNRTNREKQIR